MGIAHVVPGFLQGLWLYLREVHNALIWVQLLGRGLTAHASEFGCTLENTICLSIVYHLHRCRAQKVWAWNKKPHWDSMTLTEPSCKRHLGNLRQSFLLIKLYLSFVCRAMRFNASFFFLERTCLLVFSLCEILKKNPKTILCVCVFHMCLSVLVCGCELDIKVGCLPKSHSTLLFEQVSHSPQSCLLPRLTDSLESRHMQPLLPLWEYHVLESSYLGSKQFTHEPSLQPLSEVFQT